MMKKSILILTSLLSFDCMSLNHAFMVPTKSANFHRQIQLHAVETGETSSIDSFLDDLKMRLRIFQESNASGSSFKQSVANVLAGEYDEDQIKTDVEELINSAPCGKITIFLYILIIHSRKFIKRFVAENSFLHFFDDISNTWSKSDVYMGKISFMCESS